METVERIKEEGPLRIVLSKKKGKKKTNVKMNMQGAASKLEILWLKIASLFTTEKKYAPSIMGLCSSKRISKPPKKVGMFDVRYKVK